MVNGSGDAGDALSAVRAALAVRDGALAAADHDLAAVLHGAHRDAQNSMRRLDAVRSAIDSAVAGSDIDGAAAGREFGAFLVERNREISTIVTDAQAAVSAQTTVLQQLSDRYRGTAQQ